MTDERLAELKVDHQIWIGKREALMKQREDAHATIQRMAAEVQRLNTARKELDVPYKEATEKVADLAAQILAEEQTRAVEAEKQRQADLAAAEAARVVDASEREKQVIGPGDVGTLDPAITAP